MRHAKSSLIVKSPTKRGRHALGKHHGVKLGSGRVFGTLLWLREGPNVAGVPNIVDPGRERGRAKILLIPMLGSPRSILPRVPVPLIPAAPGLRYRPPRQLDTPLANPLRGDLPPPLALEAFRLQSLQDRT